MNIDTTGAMNAHRFSSLLERAPVEVDFRGRYMLTDGEEFECSVKEISLNGLFLHSPSAVRTGEHCIVYIDLIGRLEGIVIASNDDGFVLELKMSVSKRAKLASMLDLLRLKGGAALAEQRRHTRVKPDSPMTTLVKANGDQSPCEVIDLSLASASVSAEARVEVGEHVSVGKMQGVVIRLHSSGFVMEFDTVSELKAIADHFGSATAAKLAS